MMHSKQSASPVPTNLRLHVLVGVDDTGGEGEAIESRNVDQHRRTMVAAILGKDDLDSFQTDWLKLVDDLREKFGLHEFHAAHLWNGQKNSTKTKRQKEVDRAAVLDAFEAASQLCERHRVAFCTQTVHAETYATFLEKLSRIKDDVKNCSVDGLKNDLSAATDERKLAALLLLKGRVLNFVRKVGSQTLSSNQSLLIDADIQIDGSTDLNGLSRDSESFVRAGFDRCSIAFVDSHTSALVQAADMAGYIVNRHMYFLANRTTGHAAAPLTAGYKKSKELIKRTQSLMPYMVDLPKVPLRDDQVHATTYDKLQDRFRENIGLEPLDFKG